MKKLITATVLSLTALSAQADCFVATAISDVASTELAIANGAVEANPLGAGGVIVAKAGVYALKKVAGGNVEKTIDAVACPIMAGATANNVALAAGVGSSVALPIGGFVALLYINGAKFGPVKVIYNDDPNNP